DSLVPGEQFGAGGLYSVRGFDERVVSADNGHRLSLEVQTGNQWSGSNNWVSQLNYVGFVEGAALRLSNDPGGVPLEPHLASFGVGARLLLKESHQIRLDAARVISGIPSQPHGDWMLHFSYVAAL
ncbi:MAG: ShlB/FhaC/HecB family hemolysin secretion/activation protein, partial [Limnobacter sp.]|nr:ShlB/FhaC/HecB family hemolysin secretion/activation protein [Limnobacter sp.]